jgi:hypothetical protein
VSWKARNVRERQRNRVFHIVFYFIWCPRRESSEAVELRKRCHGGSHR